MRGIKFTAVCATLGISILIAGYGDVLAQAAPVANPGFPPRGTIWVMRTLSNSGSFSARIISEGEQTYKGKIVYRISNGVRSTVYDKESGNWIADLNDGKEVTSSSPHNGTLSWPLSVGKKWTARFAYEDHISRKIWNYVVTHWTVEAYEDVIVPAGTIKAFRIQSVPGLNNAVTATVWYSPELHIVVKSVVERSSDFYLGADRSIKELTEYHVAPDASAALTRNN